MMSESVPTEPSIEFTQVRKPLVVSEKPMIKIVMRRSDTRPDNIKMPWAVKQEDTIRKDAREPKERLQVGFEQARNYVNTIRKESGLPPVDSSSMEVILLSESNFAKNYQEIEGTVNQSSESSTSIGFMTENMRPVMVAQLDDMPDYITASVACHELSHRWAEKNVRAYTADKTKWKRYRISQELRRHGLSVKRITSKAGEIKDAGTSSDYLNELATNCAQKDFIERALHDSVNTFAEEAQEREASLQRFMESSSEGVIVPIALAGDPGTTAHILFPREDIYFDNQGTPLHERGTQLALTLQLATDLARFCGTVDGQSFGKFLQRAKIDPSLQPKLRQVIDGKLGSGFFDRLKSSQKSDVLTLLTDVQEKLYGVSNLRKNLGTNNP